MKNVATSGAPPASSALLMAGGRSRRMRQSFGPTHKALLPVLGLPLIERNLYWLLAQGWRDLYVAVAADETALIRHVEQHCQPLAAAFGARLGLLIEAAPLGTLGACRLCPAAGDLLVLNVDNLTSIDLGAMLALHRSRAAAMTIATHAETVRLPFGQVVMEGDRVVRWQEKPISTYQIASGIYVLAPLARQALAADRGTGPLELLDELNRSGHATLAYRHAAPWIDVNDGPTLARAGALVASHHRELDCLWPGAPMERTLLCGTGTPSLLVSRPTPVRPAAPPRAPWPQHTFIASFDEALLSGEVTRCHLFQPAAAAATVRVPGFRPLREEAALQGSRIEARCRSYQAQLRQQGAV